jgi:glycosyltransferase involved in cell wall biosynthesis
MRVALVGTELCSVQSATGGLERLLQGWALDLSKTHEVVLVDLLAEEAPDDADLGIPVIAVRSPGELPAELSRFRPDVVQVNNRPLFETGPAVRVNTFHNYPDAWSTTGPLDDQTVAEALRKARTTAVSKSLATHIEQRFNLASGEVTVSLPFVEQSFFETTHVGGGGILFPNRLLRKKGPDVVVRALEELGLAEGAVFLDYVTPFLRGSAEHLEMRSAIERSGATLVPAISGRDDLAHMYAKADVVIAVATQPEGMGLVPLEAQAVGVPVVTAGPGGLREATFEPNTHLERAEPTSLAAAIVDALDRASKTETKETIRSRFSIEASTKALERVWAGDDLGRGVVR